MNPPAPYDVEWQPYTCVRSDGPPAPGQVKQGLTSAFSRASTATTCTCPQEQDNTDFVGGRNYWDDSNNLSGGTYAFADQGVHPNNLKSQTEDQRLVTLFLTTYDSFTRERRRYIPDRRIRELLHHGLRARPRAESGSRSRTLAQETIAPPDLVINSGLSGAEFVWGHFVNVVTPDPFTTGGNGVLCQPEQLPAVRRSPSRIASSGSAV